MKITDKIIKKSGLLLGLAIACYFLFFSFLALWKYYNFGYNALDLGIINQVFYNSCQGDFFSSTIHPPTYLADHFSPILFLLLPFYCLTYPQPETLLIIQTLFLALSAWPIYLIAKNALSKGWALAAAAAWLINPLVQNANLYEFHFLHIAVFLIFWAFYFYQKNRFWPFLFATTLALLVREDVALVIFTFGLLSLIQKKKWRWIIAPAIISLVYFIFSLKIIDLFSAIGSYKFLIYYSWLGNSWLDVIKNLFLKPQLVLLHLLNIGNFEFILGLLLPLVFLPILQPVYLLLGLGIFSQLVLGGGGSATLLQIYYPALILPALFISAIFAVKKIIQKDQNPLVKLIYKEKNLSLLIFIVGFFYASAAMGPAAGSLKKLFSDGLAYGQTATRNEFIKKLPQNSAVAATYDFLAKVSSRQKVYSLNYAFLGKQQFLQADYNLPADTQYILIDFEELLTYYLQYQQNNFFKKQYELAQKEWQNILSDFGLIEISDTLALYKKGEKNKYDLVGYLDKMPNIANQNELFASSNIKFLGYNKTQNSYQLFWRVINPQQYKKNLWLQLTWQDGNKTVEQKIYPFGYNLISPNRLGVNQIIQTNYWLDSKNSPAGAYNLKMSLIEIERGGVELDSLRATKNIIDKYEALGSPIDLGKITIL